MRAPATSLSWGSTCLQRGFGAQDVAVAPQPHARTQPSPLLDHRPGRQAHGEGHQVAVGHGKEQHEGDEVGVLGEEHGQPRTLGNVAQHEEWHEQDPQTHQQGQQPAVPVGLWRKQGSLFTPGARVSGPSQGHIVAEINWVPSRASPGFHRSVWYKGG